MVFKCGGQDHRLSQLNSCRLAASGGIMIDNNVCRKDSPGIQKDRCADGLLDVRDQIKPQLCVNKMKRLLNILKIKIVNYVYKTNYSSFTDKMKFVYFKFHFIYPTGKPMAPHLLRCQGIAVGNYSFSLGRLGAGAPSTFAHLGHGSASPARLTIVDIASPEGRKYGNNAEP